MKLKELFEEREYREYRSYTTGGKQPGTELAILHRKIVRDCSEILDVYRKLKPKQVIFRGDGEGNKDDGFESSIHKDRIPLALSHEIQDYADDALKRAGFKTLRSNSIFCSANERMTEDWGTCYVIFPTNGFKYLYSKELDSGKNSYTYMWFSFNAAGAILRTDASEKEKRKRFDDKVEQLKLSDKDIADAIKHRREIMISGTKYYAISVNEDWQTPIGY